MTDLPSITTIITTYKRPQLLKRAVNSILNQTYPHFQLCVYDNASNDETGEIMREFAAKDHRVKYHCHPTNIGMMKNYEYGYSRVYTPYFSFLSDDDYVLPEFYETAMKQFVSYPNIAFAACGVHAVDEKGQLRADPISLWCREGLFNVPQGVLEMLEIKNKFLVPTGILFNHEKVRNISPDWSTQVQLMWDPDFLLQISAQYPFAITKKTCAIYLAHSNAFSTSFYEEIVRSANGFNIYMDATKQILKRILTNPNVKFKPAIKRAYIKMLRDESYGYMKNYFILNNFKDVFQLAKEMNKSYGLNLKMRFLIIRTFILIIRTFILNYARKLRNVARYFKRKLKALL